jgi:aldehyde:ferredoxin oxidoreductase
MSLGFCGKILHIDLSTGSISIEEPPESFYRKYMGGSAINMHYILEKVPIGIDPYDPENILAISTSVLTGVPFSGQSRLSINAKSPLTGGIGDSQSGGFFPAELKFAGYDGIIIRGKSAKPVYLWIHDGEVEISEASHLWGKVTGEAQKEIQKELGDEKIKVLQIGPAGENLVRYGAIISMCNRANGRTGMGAVMGSKNLKAIAVRGTRKVHVADKKAVRNLARRGVKDFPDSQIAGMGRNGTAAILSFHQEIGALPSFNYRQGVFDQWESIDGASMYDSILKGRETGSQDKEGRDTCYGCVVRCKRVVEINEGEFQVDPLYGGPEYETVGTFGSYCGIGDPAAIAKANEICNKYGMDTISCGATIAWAIEAFEAGEITPEMTGGLTLKFGDATLMIKLTEMIARKEGFGDVLSEGSARASAMLGVGKRFLITCKGTEMPAHMPQMKKGLGLIYAVNPFGADHMSCEHDQPYEDGYEAYKERLAFLGLENPQEQRSLSREKVRYAVKTQFLFSVLDSLNLCAFVFGSSYQLYGPEDIVLAVNAVTGWDTTIDEILELGKRRLNMLRVFNAREGFDKESDKLPIRFFDTPLQGGPSNDFIVDKHKFDSALVHYYDLCGWDPETGNPSLETLKQLGIENI